MIRILLPLILALALMTSAAVQAAAAASPAAPAPAADASTNAYSATVPVAGTSGAQRNAAIRAALGVVLKRVAPGFRVDPHVLAKAANYVRDYHYQPAATAGGLALQVDFDPGAVGRLIAPPAGSVAAGGSPPPASGPASGAAPALSGGGPTLWVDGIDSADAFTTLLATLRGDDALHDVTPVAAAGNGVLLRLDADRSLTDALAALTGPGSHLAPDPQPHPGAAVTLRWVP